MKSDTHYHKSDQLSKRTSPMNLPIPPKMFFISFFRYSTITLTRARFFTCV